MQERSSTEAKFLSSFFAGMSHWNLKNVSCSGRFFSGALKSNLTDFPDSFMKPSGVRKEMSKTR